MDAVRFRVGEAIPGNGLVLSGRLESGRIRGGDVLFLRNERAVTPLTVTRIELEPDRGVEEAVPGPADYRLTVTGITPDHLSPPDSVSSIGYHDATGDRRRDFRTTDELRSALEASGAASCYSQLLNALPLSSLEKFFDPAVRVQARPELVTPLILHSDWRISLLGTAVAVLIHSERLVAPLIEGLARGSWVAPQLAAGILALPSPNSDLTKLRAVVDRASAASDAKTVLSAFAVLDGRGDATARTFATSALFGDLWAKDGTRCVTLAARWRGVWNVAGPLFRTTIPSSKLL